MSYSPVSAGECVATGAKAHVLFGKMLDDNDFWALLECDSPQEIAGYLRRKEGYAPYLETIVLANVHRAELEHALLAVPLYVSASFLPYLNGARMAFLKAWVERFQAGLLKQVMRWLFAGRGERESLRSSLKGLPFVTLPFDALLSCKDFEEFIKTLKATRYYPALREPVDWLLKGRGNLYSCESAVDAHVISNIYRAALNLPILERTEVLNLLGNLIDILNIYFCYRAKRFYAMNREEIVNRLLPVRFKIKGPTINRLASSEDMESFWSVLSSTPCSSAFGEEPPKDELALERDMKRFLRERALRVFRRGSPSFHTAMAYLMLLELEVGDIITIIEDVRYDYNRRIAAAFLARPLIPGGAVSWR
jgi:V/A-type H+-transporting ATPase subunit C